MLKTSPKIQEVHRIKIRSISTKELNFKAMLIFNMWSLAKIFLILEHFMCVVLIKNTFGRNVVLFKPASRI